jgi:hypothetical protein
MIVSILLTILYAVVFLFVWVLVVGAQIFPTEYLFKRVTRRELNPKGGQPGRIATVIMMLILFWPIPGTYYLLGTFHYRPPFLSTGSGTISEGAPKDRIVALEREAERIKKTLSNIDNLSVKQIQTELQKALKFVEHLQEEAIQQEQLVNSLIRSAEQHRKEAEQAKAMADSVSAMTAPQLEAIRSLITQNAKQESDRAFWLGVFVSFPIGFLSSLLASWFFGRAFGRRPN